MSTDSRKRRPRADLVVLAAGLAVVAAVWALSCWWSFAEQTRAARSLHFEHPAVLPWMLDALAVALALVALSSAIAGQAATAARLGVVLALAGSVWANTRGVAIRSGNDPQTDAVVMAAIAPLSAFIALEVILGKIRRLVLWMRGEPAPAAVPPLRLARLLLSPRTFGEWREAVLTITKPAAVEAPDLDTAPGRGQPTAVGSAAAPAPHDQGTTSSPLGVVPADAGRGYGPPQVSPAGPGTDAAVTAPPPAVSTGRGADGAPTAPPARAPLTASADASEVAPVVHLVPASDRAADAPRTASAGASGTGARGASDGASRRGASAAASASGRRRITASASASDGASEVPETGLVFAVRDALAATGDAPSARALAKAQRCHQTKAKAAIDYVLAELASREVAP